MRASLVFPQPPIAIAIAIAVRLAVELDMRAS